MSPLGTIILARAEVLGAQEHDDGRPLSLMEMSARTATNPRKPTDPKLTRAAINEWILGRVKRPTPELLDVLAAALADEDYDYTPLKADMRAAVGLPRDDNTLPAVDVAELSRDDVHTLNVVADRLRESRREGALAASTATDRANRLIADGRALDLSC